MGVPRKRPRQKFKRLRCVLSRIVSSTEKPALILSVSRSRLHDSVVQHACQARFGSAPPHWVDNQASIGFSSTLSRPGWSDVVFAFHDNEELGPRMLARIAKLTGLNPEDL